MNKTVGPPSITPNSASGGNINPSMPNNLYSYYYKAIEQFQKPNSTDKELCDILRQGPMPTNQFYNNFLNEINNRNNMQQQQQQSQQQQQQQPQIQQLQQLQQQQQQQQQQIQQLQQQTQSLQQPINNSPPNTHTAFSNRLKK